MVLPSHLSIMDDIFGSKHSRQKPPTLPPRQFFSLYRAPGHRLTSSSLDVQPPHVSPNRGGGHSADAWEWAQDLFTDPIKPPP